MPSQTTSSAIHPHTPHDLSAIQAISLDLDDTLWSVWPTIRRAEKVLFAWLQQHAPATATLLAGPEAVRAVREKVEQLRPDLAHDLSGLRRESIRMSLRQAGDAPELADAAFEVFFAERQRVDFYDDAIVALEFLAARFRLIALSNGNADVNRVGIGQFFEASLSASQLGVAKPDARIFAAAAKQLDLPHHAILHVGDDAHADVQGAMLAGMPAVWLNREDKLWPHEGRPDFTVANLHELCALLQHAPLRTVA